MALENTPIVDPAEMDPNQLPETTGNTPLQIDPNAVQPGQVSVQTNTTGVSTPIQTPATPLTAQGAADATVGNLSQQQEVEREKTRLSAAEHDKEAGILTAGSADNAQRLKDMHALAEHTNAAYQTGIDQDRKNAIEIGNIKEDPNHLWNSKDTGGKVAAWIGSVLGGIGQGLQMWGGNKNAHNAYLDQLDDMIKQDIESQRENKDSKIKSFMQQHNITESAANRASVEQIQNQREFILSQSSVRDQLAAQVASAASPMDKANGQQALLVLDQKIADERRQLGIHGENQAAAVAAGVRKQQEAALQHQRDLEKIRATAEGEAAKGVVVEQAKAAAETPEKEHEAEMKQVSEERIKLQQLQLQAHNGLIPWETGKEKLAQKNLDELDARERKANEKYLAAKGSKKGVVTSAADAPK